MLYIIYGFLFGLIIPSMARRFAKFMPASAAETIYRLLCPVKHVSKHKQKNNPHYQTLQLKLFYRSCLYGILCASLFITASLHFDRQGLWGILAFLWALLLLLEIDYKTYLLPDIITIPLLIGGFCFSVFEGTWILSAESAIGATLGFILPTIAELLMIWKRQNAIGLGDIKLFAAVGAWIGIQPITYCLVLSCLLFAVQALILRQREGAFGPAISAAAIIVAFYFF